MISSERRYGIVKNVLSQIARFVNRFEGLEVRIMGGPRLPLLDNVHPQQVRDLIELDNFHFPGIEYIQ